MRSVVVSLHASMQLSAFYLISNILRSDYTSELLYSVVELVECLRLRTFVKLKRQIWRTLRNKWT